MVTIDEAKAMAKRLRSALATELPSLTHSACLELVGRQLGHADWNTAVAALVSNAAGLKPAIPILRIFDEPKAHEFYLEFLGFTVEFEHRFEENLPLYMGIRRSELRLHLSAHHGDATPGSTVFVPMTGLHEFQAELVAKNYSFGRPEIEHLPWGDWVEVHDPFGNRIRFCEYHDT